MNCKPGDLAIVIGGSKYSGMIVEVLYQAPSSVSFTLPDGFTNLPIQDGLLTWVIKFQRPVRAPVKGYDGKVTSRMALYGTGADRKLRPVSGLPMEEETEQKLKEPA